jgi:hypothetical protein
MRRATIYKRRSRFFVHAISQTTHGVWILSKPVLSVDDSASDADLGVAVHAALEGSRNDVIHPQSWAGLLGPLLKLARVKSWRLFVKKASCAEIEQEAESISVIPTRRLAAESGFEHDTARAMSVDARAVVDLGRSVRAIL